MGLPSSPGSYVYEKDLSTRVRAVSTSIGAIVGPLKKGQIGERILVTDAAELIAWFGKPDPRFSQVHYAALEFLKKSSRLYVTRVINDDPARGAVPLTAGAILSIDDIEATVPVPRLSLFADDEGTPIGLYDPYNTYTFLPSAPGIGNVLFMACAIDPGDWNNSIYLQVRPALKAGLSAFQEGYDDPYSFWVDVFIDYRNERQLPDESFLVKRVPSQDGYGNQLFIEDVINAKSKIIRVRNNPFAGEIKILQTRGLFLDKGTNGARVSFGQMMRAWDLYADVEAVDVNLLIQGGAPNGMSDLQDIADIQRHMNEIARSRMDCVAVLDIPESEQETAAAVAYRRAQLNMDSSYSAIYSPNVTILDTYNNMDVSVAPSGFAAAACAFTDGNYEVWFAPAGMIRGALSVKKAKYIYNQGHRDALNDAQINAIRYFPKGAGYKIWGADTMQVEASALTNLNVRRLMNMIEKSIGITNMYSVFDPNDQILRSRMSATVEFFLEPILRAQGLYWYKVICDDSNNQAATIAAGILVLDVYFDPVITTKRIFLNANIMRTGSNYREYIINKQ
jgi:hypothetical protein